jgi:hypothetical protein
LTCGRLGAILGYGILSVEGFGFVIAILESGFLWGCHVGFEDILGKI